ncbi:MAG: DUF4238 domain-containing protein [Desulfovibrio sp.]|uniref:DUF4238 domain-containing protein n=1 Tax=Desulfovibrio sp. 7SRBS1 TaxID=3378064 RepID=UPI003B4064D8
MPGKKQHFIQQALLKGFSKSKKQIYLYKKNKPNALLVAIKNVAAERFFYGKEDGVTDSSLTDYENKNADIIKSLQNGIIPKKKENLIRFIQICAFRTKSLRQKSDYSTKSLLNKFVEEDNLRQVLTNLVEDELKKNSPYFASIPDEVLIQMDANKKEILENMFCNLKYMSASVKERIMNTEFGKYAQKKNIPKFTSESFDLNRLKKNPLFSYTWEILSFNESIILGDNPVIGIDAEEKHSSLFKGYKDIQFVYMPISSSKVLVGKKNANFNYSAAEINTMSASLSHDSFFAADEKQNHLINLISTHEKSFFD